jgi:hypothetical protein
MMNPGRSGVALLITLLTLSLMTIIIVAFLGTMTWETSASRQDFEKQKAQAMVSLGMSTAIGQLRYGLGVWDNPFVNFTNAAPAYYWSVSPGILTRWSYGSTTPQSNYALFSVPPSANSTTNLVALNAPEGDGTYPVIGGANPPDLSVYWVNVQTTPNLPASASNPLIGRYAFWVDDENAKINLNTADGTMKYTANSLGLGTPSEVSLQVLQSGGSPISTTTATNLVYIARTTGFNSPREILRTPGAAPDLYSNNVFNVTTWGRSPELNLFGEPKINLVPASSPGTTASLTFHGWLQTNDITGQALTQIYPTPGQLPAYVLKDPSASTLPQTNGWRPLVTTQNYPSDYGGHQYQGDGYGFETGLIAKYLSGTNGMGKAIQWPVLPSSGSTGFMGKYSLRQLDSISFQIVDISGKMTTPEGTNCDNLSSAANTLSFSTPAAYRGILSQQLVPGAARSAKVNELYISASASGQSAGVPGVGSYTPPQLQMNIYLECFFPAGFGGVDLFNKSVAPFGTTLSAGNYELGAGSTLYGDSLNMLDMPSATNGGACPAPVTTSFPSLVRRTSSEPYYAAQTNGYWQDTLLQNNAGIDFIGNSTNYADPDQVRAAAYHAFLTNTAFWTNHPGVYPGSFQATGPNPTPLLRMWTLSQSTPSPAPLGTAWYPGQYRALINRASGLNYPMAPNSSSVTFSGGLVVNGTTMSTRGDPDPTPFEAAVRGIGGTTNFTNPSSAYLNWCSYDNEAMTNAAWAVTPGQTNQTTALGSTETVQSRMMAGVIPVNFTIGVPSLPTATNTATYHAEVADPLVNKFPGDWVTNSSSSTIGLLPVNAGNEGWSYYYNGQNAEASSTVHHAYTDPDSFWMPTLDPGIPRSARFPNIGYLQYLRTGVIPDDETVSISLQHGTPFRCLNLNSSTDASQKLTVAGTAQTAYPDWAMLDLFTIPSTLMPFGGPYGYYSAAGTWTSGALFAGNPTNMYDYGTWGGSTPGKINPNGSVIYTTNVNTPVPGFYRTLPLQAVLHGLTNNATISSGQSAATAIATAPTFTGGAAVIDASLAANIATYIGQNGPLCEPAEICNIPVVSANVAVGYDSTHNNPTRNDLVRQIVGNLTTQSNTFSIWVEGQSVSKSKGNVNYGQYEAGDQITATERYHFVVERSLDLGADGLVGNSAASPGTPVGSGNSARTNILGDADGIAGTYDDPVNSAYHPPNPRYLYRVLYAEEIRN